MATTALMSGLQFDALPYEEGRRWELLEGDLIEVPSATLRHQQIVSRLLASRRYLGQEIQGRVFADVEFALSADTRLRPDVCLLLPTNRSTGWDRIPIPGAPDLAIEVISPSERTTESQAKVQAYLRDGVSEVWQIYPRLRIAQIHTSESHRSHWGSTNPSPPTCSPAFPPPSRPFWTNLNVPALPCVIK